MSEPEGILLTPGGQKKLGTLVELKDLSISDAIRQRGGGQSQINQLATNIQTLTVAELANLAADGDSDAETAIKILKQAKKKRDKYGGK
ncbi:hypothetical protein ACQ4M3_38005 [Leptolyngbya sp. AN03gr2]|uniref:hypothetical protein n=1 Tax=unclassified Leptolyngbya TaxID=2650499 RepID=UPI003D31CC4F